MTEAEQKAREMLRGYDVRWEKFEGQSGVPLFNLRESIAAALEQHGREQREAGRREGIQASWDAINKWICKGPLPSPQAEQRNGMVLAANEVFALLQPKEPEADGEALLREIVEGD